MSKILLGYLFGTLLATGAVFAIPFFQPQEQMLSGSTFFPSQGGTGISSTTAGNVGKYLKVSDDSPFTYSFDTPAGGAGGSGTVSTSSIPTISHLAYWTTSGANVELLGSTATTTLTENSSALSLSQPVVIIGSTGSVLSLDTSGAWSGTAGSLAANGANCSSGSAPLGVDALGAVESCFDVWTEAENTSAGYVASTRTLTVAGTANQITSSAGAQDLSADRTWTLSLPNQLIFPANASTTGKFSVVGAATSTDLQGNTEVWGMLGIGRTATTTIRGDNATSTFASGVSVTDLLSSNAPTFSSLTSALILTGAGGGLAEYAGTSCTNQFVRSLSALGAATCASINNGDWSGTDLSVANGGTGLSTFGGNNTILYTTAADTLASESTFTYTSTNSQDLLTVANATTTALTVSSYFALPNGATQSPTVSGQCAIDTTSGQLKCYTGSELDIYQAERFPTFGISTTTTWTGTTTMYLGPAGFAQTWNKIRCETNASFLGVSVYDGTNRMDYFVASTTIGTVTLGTNNTFTAGESRRVDFGTTTTAVTKAITCVGEYDITAD